MIGALCEGDVGKLGSGYPIRMVPFPFYIVEYSRMSSPCRREITRDGIILLIKQPFTASRPGIAVVSSKCLKDCIEQESTTSIEALKTPEIKRMEEEGNRATAGLGGKQLKGASVA